MNEQMKHISAEGTASRYATTWHAGYGILAHSTFLSSYMYCKGRKVINNISQTPLKMEFCL